MPLDPHMQAAIDEARLEAFTRWHSHRIGAGARMGHRPWAQQAILREKNPILHGEDGLPEQRGPRIGSYKGTTIYSTLMPCYMCAGTIVRFRNRVIVGEETGPSPVPRMHVEPRRGGDRPGDLPEGAWR